MPRARIVGVNVRATYQTRKYFGVREWDPPVATLVPTVLKELLLPLPISEIVEKTQQAKKLLRRWLPDIKGIIKSNIFLLETASQKRAQERDEEHRKLMEGRGLPSNLILMRGACSDARDNYAKHPDVVIVKLELVFTYRQRREEIECSTVIYDFLARRKVRNARRHQSLFGNGKDMEVVPSFIAASRRARA